MSLSRYAAGGVLWAAASALVALGVLGAASIGLFILPFGLLGVAILAMRETPNPWGAGIGPAVLLATIGLIDLLDGVPECTGEGVMYPPAFDTPSRCESGGIPGQAFLVLAAVIFVAGLAGSIVQRPKRRRD